MTLKSYIYIIDTVVLQAADLEFSHLFCVWEGWGAWAHSCHSDVLGHALGCLRQICELSCFQMSSNVVFSECHLHRCIITSQSTVYCILSAFLYRHVGIVDHVAKADGCSCTSGPNMLTVLC